MTLYQFIVVVFVLCGWIPSSSSSASAAAAWSLSASTFRGNQFLPGKGGKMSQADGAASFLYGKAKQEEEGKCLCEGTKADNPA